MAACLGQDVNTLAECPQRSDFSPAQPSVYFTRPPRVCQDSLFAQDAPCPKQDRSE